MIRVAAVGTGPVGRTSLLRGLFGDVSGRVSWNGREIDVIDADRAAVPPADVYLLTIVKDLTSVEHDLARTVRRPITVALNKADTYTNAQLRTLLAGIRNRLAGIVPADRVVACAAAPVRIRVRVQSDGSVIEDAAVDTPMLADAAAAVLGCITDAEQSPRVIARDLIARGSAAWREVRDARRRAR